MLNNEVREYLLAGVFNAAVKAGAAIMEIYARKEGYGVSYKSDHTPITEADCAAHKVIRETLGPTRIPILSEEGRELGYEERRNWEMFWLVDPLDGTIEFLKGNNEFTVNIALMENNRAIAAVVYVPYLEKMYLAERGRAAWVKRNVKPVHDAAYGFEEIESDMQPLPLAETADRPFSIAVSRSHQTPETAERIDALRAEHPGLQVIEQGSSYKFCLLAEGSVDYYPRTTHTYEWDTAAGELILAEAGGETRSLPGGDELQYNKENLQNPWFECRAKKNEQ